MRLLASMLTASLAAACSGTPTPVAPPGPLGPADRFAAVDFDGDGRDEIVRFASGQATWTDGTVVLGGAVQVVRRGVPDDRGREGLYIATGRGRRQADAPARIWRLDHTGATQIWERNDGRNRVTDLRITAEGVYAALFGPDKKIEGGWIRDGQFHPVTAASMAMQQIPLPDGRIVLGRLYGDTPRSHGDLRVRSAGSADQILPTRRGVRTISTGDVDGDGHLDLIVADGWHFRYGTDAEARLTVFAGPDFSDRRLIGDVPGEYTFNEIALLPGQPPRILATGTQHLHLFTRDARGWRVEPVAPMNETDQVTVWRDGATGFAVVSGTPGRAIRIAD